MRSISSRHRATPCSWSSTTSTPCAAPTGWWTSVPTLASTAARCSTAGRPMACARSRPRTPRATCSPPTPACTARHARRRAGWNCAASPATTCTASTRGFRWACSPPSPACPARASPAWSARRWSNWSANTSATSWSPTRPRPMQASARNCHRASWPRPPAACTPALRRSAGSSTSTRSRSAARRAPTWRPIPACSTTCASCSPPPPPRRRAALMPAVSPSTSPGQANNRAAATPAKAKASSASSCCSCPACTRHARPAWVRATTPRRSRSAGTAAISPRCWR